MEDSFDVDGRYAVYKFTLERHKLGYDLTRLLGFYGTGFCERFQQAWTRCYEHENGGTSYTAFKAIVRTFLQIANMAIADQSSAAARVYSVYRDRKRDLPTEIDWDQLLETFRGMFADLRNRYVIGTDNENTRNKYVEIINSALDKLSRFGFVRSGRINHRFKYLLNQSNTKTFAQQKIENGSLNLAGLSAEEYSRRFMLANGEALEALRKCFSDEFCKAYAEFQRGQLLMDDPGLPDLETLRVEMARTEKPDFRWAQQTFGLNTDQYHGMAAILVCHLVYNKNERQFPIKKVRVVLKAAGGDRYLQGLIEPTPAAHTAVFHVIMIDANLNAQPILDLPSEPFVKKAERGKRKIATTRSVKNRKGGNVVEGNLSADKSQSGPEGISGEGNWPTVTSRNGPAGISGEEMILLYQIMTQGLRILESRRAGKLFVWRKPTDKMVRDSAPPVEREWRADFIARIQGNPVLSALQINSQVIVRSVRNRLDGRGEYDYRVMKALSNHSSSEMPFLYMDANGVQKPLESFIRRFMDAWEAVSVMNIPNAARHLGIHESELERAIQLGLDGGLTFASQGDLNAGNASEPQTEPLPMIDPKVNRLNVNPKSLRLLIIARIALEQQMDKMMLQNPGRFVTTWLPWLGMVQGYCKKLIDSRFRRDLEIVIAETREAVRTGLVPLPVLW